VPNTDQAADGLIGIAIMLQQAQGIPAGTYVVVEVCFTVAGVTPVVQTELHFIDRPTFMQVADNFALEREAQWLDGTVTIVPPPPQIQSAVSRTLHGLAGNIDIGIKAAGAVECRQNGPTTLLVTFDQAIQQVSGTVNDVTITSGTVGNLAIDGSELTITMNGATNAALFTIGFPGIKGSSGQVVADTLCFGVLTGDANGDRKVNVLDLPAIKGGVNQPVTAGNFRLDINADGRINVLDLLAIKGQLNTAVSNCP